VLLYWAASSRQVIGKKLANGWQGYKARELPKAIHAKALRRFGVRIKIITYKVIKVVRIKYL